MGIQDGGDEVTEKKQFLLYKSWSPMIEALNAEQAGILFKAIYVYQMTWQEPEMDASVYPIFCLFKAKFDEDQAAYETECERNRRNGARGGRPKTDKNREKPKETQENPVGFSETQNNPDKDKDIDKDKDKENKKPQRTQASLVVESNLLDPVKEKLLEWLKYKKERRESYKETGLRALISEVHRHELEDGADAVMAIINESMANGWRGIIWEKRNARQPTARSGTKEKIHTFTENAYDFKSLEAQLIKNA